MVDVDVFKLFMIRFLSMQNNDVMTNKINGACVSSPQCQRLAKMRGVGPIGGDGRRLSGRGSACLSGNAEFAATARTGRSTRCVWTTSN